MTAVARRWRPTADTALLVACLRAAALAPPGPARQAALRTVRALATGSAAGSIRFSAAATAAWVASCRYAEKQNRQVAA